MILHRALRAPVVVARRAARAARRRLRPHALVLCYHRIAPPATVDPWRLRVAPERFTQHLELLREVGELVPLADLRARLDRGDARRPLIALTFDDGYRDDLEVALPILQRHQAPATFFVSAAMVGDRRGYFWDELAQLVLGAHPMAARIECAVGDERLAWRDPAPAGVAASPAGRAALHHHLYWKLRPLAPAARHLALDGLRAALGLSADDAVADPLLTESELCALAASPLAEVGAHGLVHEELPGMAPERLRANLEGSREACARLFGRPPRAFAYPYGLHDGAARSAAAAAGFEMAFTTHEALCFASTDPHRLPRCTVVDWNRDAFRQRLAWAWLP